MPLLPSKAWAENWGAWGTLSMASHSLVVGVLIGHNPTLCGPISCLEEENIPFLNMPPLPGED